MICDVDFIKLLKYSCTVQKNIGLESLEFLKERKRLYHKADMQNYLHPDDEPTHLLVGGLRSK